jgi:alkylation response protein AidB-like acyl-CoA dehydrogenase
MHDMELRRNDYSLSDDEEQVYEAFSKFFVRECPIDRVRARTKPAFDPVLWSDVCELGAVSMGLPEDGGDGEASLVHLVLSCEAMGTTIAPVPLPEAVAATRAASSREVTRNDRVLELLHAAIDGREVLTLALQPCAAGEAVLVPAGSVASAVVGLVDETLVLHEPPDRLQFVENLADHPLAWCTFDGGTTHVLAEGELARQRFHAAVTEWRLLTAGALVGLSQSLLEQSVDYASSRVAFGSPISTFQGISHQIASVAIGIGGARNLVRKAAWYLGAEPDVGPQLPGCAFWIAKEVAGRAAEVAVHVQGGLGVTLESDSTVFFGRAKGWPVLAGDPQRELVDIGRAAAPRWVADADR